MIKSKVKIKGKGPLWDVDFELKGQNSKKLRFTYSSNKKVWESNIFKHETQIHYKLCIYARAGTGWEGSINDVEDDHKYIEWKLSKTGQDHESDRTRPNKIKPR